MTVAGAAPVVVLVGTLDTKGHEYGFLRDRLREQGAEALLVDAGVLGEPQVEPEPMPEFYRELGRLPPVGVVFTSTPSEPLPP